jgi:hypothetical protein
MPDDNEGKIIDISAYDNEETRRKVEAMEQERQRNIGSLANIDRPHWRHYNEEQRLINQESRFKGSFDERSKDIDFERFHSKRYGRAKKSGGLREFVTVLLALLLIAALYLAQKYDILSFLKPP